MFTLKKLLLISLLFHTLNLLGAPHKKVAPEDIVLDQVADSIVVHLEQRGEDPESFIAYQTEDDQVYAYSDSLFCVYSFKDAFNIHDGMTLGMATKVREMLSIPQGGLQCMSVQAR